MIFSLKKTWRKIKSQLNHSINSSHELKQKDFMRDATQYDKTLIKLVMSFNNAASAIRKTQNVTQHELISVDFETTGLTTSDQIISMGFCPINQLTISLKSCRHFLVNAQSSPSDKSITIHGITHDDLDNGVSTTLALKDFLTLCQGKIIVAHFHKIERQFIQSLTYQLTGNYLNLNILDTFQIAKNSMQRRQQAITPNSLRLFNLRKSYHLPFYKAHNALEDAISTAELLLAQISSMDSEVSSVSLKDLDLIQVNR